MMDTSLEHKASQAGPGRVLVVDDEHALRRVIARSLAARGSAVSEAADGAEAERLLQTAEFDAILCDIAMPGLSGVEVLRAARRRDLDVPVILMTGSPDVASAAAAVQHGALEYLIKPVPLERIHRIVNRAVNLCQIARAKREALALVGDGTGLASDRAGLEASLGRSLSSLWMAYQPIVRSSDRTIFGYEALLRSDEPALPHPGAVLDAAERLDRLPDVGRAVRNHVGGTMTGSPGVTVFVNLHTRDLLDDTLAESGHPLAANAARVVLEITERAALDQVKDVRERVARLRSIGYRIAIDDLGAGYAGLTSFAQLEPEIVKLDMSLVRDVQKTPTKQKLIRTMTALCKDMGMLVVAEGVETSEERDTLVELGCDLLQGYLLAKPGRPFPVVSW